MLCPRARAVLERQLQLRERLCREGRIDHEHLFFHGDGAPIRRHSEVYGRWRATLKRLPIRYRKPYAARHSSVSWNLMAGKNPLWVAAQHGHSVLTMLSVYAAWTHGAREAEIAAIRYAPRAPAYATRIGEAAFTAPASVVAKPREVSGATGDALTKSGRATAMMDRAGRP